MKTNKNADIYGMYVIRFHAKGDSKHFDSLPIFACDVGVVCLTVDSAKNIPAGTEFDVYFIGRYNRRNHTVTNRVRMHKIFSGKKAMSNHSKAAEAATPERKEERKA